jgi:DNA repair ATPase RecN
LKSLLLLKNKLQEQTQFVQSSQKEIEALENELIQAENKVKELALILTESRKKTSVQAKESIQATMRKVGMPNAIFEIVV